MEYFTADGAFWLPRQPARKPSGKLTFDESGVTLQLEAPLHEPVTVASGVVGGSAEWLSEPLLHGRLRDGREVTLLKLNGLSMPVEGVEETWFAQSVLSGGLVDGDAFVQVMVFFDYLMPWARPPGLMSGEVKVDNFTIDTRQVTLAETTLEDGRNIRLIAGVVGKWGETSVHIDRWCSFKISGDPTTIEEIVNDWVGPLQDLLVVCLGRAVRLEELYLQPSGRGERDSMLQLSFAAIQPGGGPQPTISQVDSYDSPTLLTYASSPLPFEQLIANWFELRARASEAVTLFCGPYYAPFIYSQHRYASTFQSGEALARRAFDTKEKTPSQHRDRVEAVRLALLVAQLNYQLDAETVDWASRVVQGRNDKSLRQLMEELILSTGEVGQQLVAAAANLADLAAKARTSVSHPGAKGPGTLRRYRLGESIIWVIRVRLLAELGISVDELSAKIMQKPSFLHLLEELPALAESDTDTN